MAENLIKLLKTHVEKMSTFRLSTILMKTNQLSHSFHDVDENEGERRRTQRRAVCVTRRLMCQRVPVPCSLLRWAGLASALYEFQACHR